MFSFSVRPYAIIALLIVAIPAHALQFSQTQCSKKFVGKVVKIEKAKAPIHNLSRDLIYFSVEEKIKGQVSELEVVKLLKFGPIKVKEGEQYLVQLEKGNICDIHSVTH